MKISVVVCTHNRADSLRLTLDSMAQLEVPIELPWEILVVDNNSSDATPQVVAAAGERLPCRYLFERRQGKSFALNSAVEHAQGQVIAFTDDDVTFDQSWLAAVWRAFGAPDCAGIGGRILPIWNSRKPRWYSDTGPYRLMKAVVQYDHGDDTREIASEPFGANMAFRREAFVQCGLFRTDLGPNRAHPGHGEDTEFCRRVRAAGGRILYVADAVVYHPVSEERLRKAYFQSWNYVFGMTEVRLEPPPRGARWFGTPRYMFRDLAQNAALWLTSVSPRRRFFYKLACCRTLGQMAEARATARPRLDQDARPAAGA